ncbi:MAG: transglutaminase-like domain-containing protein [Clostridiales bacterium]|nr:transglutaminase-like domain-containing protein [Clostridiales bacterium]
MYKQKRVVSMLLALVMVAAFVGCSKKKEKDDVDVQPEIKVEQNRNEVTNVPIQPEINNKKLSSELLNRIASNYEPVSLDQAYESPLYRLPNDHVFEFEASEAVEAVLYKAFDVYNDSNFEEQIKVTNCQCRYENGKVFVEPGRVLFLDDDRSRYVEDGTWGSMNKLYLVQNIDLQTGEDLEKPIVTPFSIAHDLDAVALVQGVSNQNTYTLSWEAVPGAVSYRVYENIGGDAYDLQCTTSATSVTVEEFADQKENEKYDELIKKDLEEAGYTVDHTGYTFMNSGVKCLSDSDGYFTVIAVDANGKQSGISNIVNVREIANRLPYTIRENITMDIENTEDAPTYVNVEMLDGSTSQMLINYHNAQAYKFEDTNKILIKAHVCNTLFDDFLITLYGKDYDEFVSEASLITERQDKLNISGGCSEPEIMPPSAPSNQTTPDDEAVEHFIQEVLKLNDLEPGITNIPEPEITSEPAITQEPIVTSKPETNPMMEDSVPYQLYQEAALEVEKRLSNVGNIDPVIYANNELEAWIAYCLLAQMDIIPVPISVYPEAANVDYVFELMYEAYRQNPSSGLLADAGYCYDYESLVIKYREDTNERLEKTTKELERAQSIASSVTDSSMSEAEKVYAINEYLCTNASYDFDSCSTNVSEGDMNTAFKDAHTPYGILCNNYGVCESYAEAFALIGRYAGLDVLMEIGTLEGGGHEWNRVCVDGSWCILDVTNNDIDYCSNALLNVTESQSEGILIPDGTAYINAISSTDDTKEYYYSQGMKASTITEAFTLLKSQLESNDIGRIRVPNGISEEDLKGLMQQLVRELQLESVGYTVFANVLEIRK